MSRLSISSIVATLCGSVLLAGCPDDPMGNETESTSGDSTDTTMTPVTVTVGMTVGMTTDGSTTVEPTTADTTVGVDDTTTGDTTTDDTTTDDTTTDDTTTGEPPGDGYGDCANNPENVACGAGEICLDGGSAAACSLQDCTDAGDCAVPATGDAVVSCFDLDEDFSNDCYLDCSGGETCPDGMICMFDFVCLWQLVAPGGGLCPDQDLGDVVPQMVMGDNTGLFDDHIPSCVAGGGEDAMYQFTAAAAGTYVFDTAGSTFDTSLAVLDGCGGPELACNDDFGMGVTSQVSLPLAAGQSVIVVVDSFDGEVGAFNLAVSFLTPGACPDQDLGSTVPQAVMGDNTGLANDHAPSCAPGGDDALYQFTAPAAGTYVFDTTGSMIDTVLSVLDGCGGPELDCNDDFGVGLTSQITIDLIAGQSVIIAVQGYGGDAGPFNLNIAAL